LAQAKKLKYVLCAKLVLYIQVYITHTLIFFATKMSSEPVDISEKKDGSLYKLITEEGHEGAECPKIGQTCIVHYTGTIKTTGKKFDSSRDRNSPFDFTVGIGSVISGWDIGIPTMRKGERATFTIGSALAYGEMGAGSDIGPNEDLCFDIELIDFHDKKKSPNEMTSLENIEEATKLKEEGNAEFKKGNYEEACVKYNNAVLHISQSQQGGPDDDKIQDTQDLAKVCRLNLANASLKTKQWSVAIDNCTKVLETDENNTKALFRRGCALQACSLVEEAKKDFVAGAHIEPASKEFRHKIEECKTMQQEARKKEKATFGGLFNKIDMYGEKQTLVVSDHQYDQLPKVFLDLQQGSGEIRRIVIVLFTDTVPKTAENFRALCTGEKGEDTKGLKMHFKGAIFHRIIKGFMMQGGDYENSNGTGGAAIYGDKFEDENFVDSHERRGLLSMANSGPNSNGSQFFILFQATPHLNGKHVVFGDVYKGLEFLDEFEQVECEDDKPKEPVKIIDCGEWKEEN